MHMWCLHLQNLHNMPWAGIYQYYMFVVDCFWEGGGGHCRGWTGLLSSACFSSGESIRIVDWRNRINQCFNAIFYLPIAWWKVEPKSTIPKIFYAHILWRTMWWSYFLMLEKVLQNSDASYAACSNVHCANTILMIPYILIYHGWV